MIAAILYGLAAAVGAQTGWTIRGRDMILLQASVWAATLLLLATSAVNFYVALS